MFAVLVLAVIVSWAVPVGAQELPLRFFSTADGLGDNRVKRIVLDSRGLLWVCTNSGISRFDGAHFQSFGVAEGLPFSIINDLLETPDGDFWLASNGGGVIRVRLSSQEQRYEAFAVSREPTTNRVNRLYRVADGTIWAGTDGGLFRMAIGSGGRPVFERVGLRRHVRPEESVQVWAFATDREGTLWVGTRFGLVRLLPGGRIVWYPVREELETDNVFSLLYVPEDDVLWIGHESGLAIFRPPPASSYGEESATGEPFEDGAIARGAAPPHRLQAGQATLPRASGEAMYFDTSGGEDPATVPHLLRSRSSAIRIITARSVFEYAAGRFVKLEDARLRSALASAGEDREGNLWLGTQAAGLWRMARRGFVTFREADGIGPTVASVFENRAGELVVVSQGWQVSRFDGERFETVRANMPAAVRRAGWRGNLKTIEDHLGDWWFATGAGLVRFSGIRRVDDLASAVPTIYTTNDGLAQDSINRLFEDSRGDIWIAPFIPGRETLTRWDRTSGRFQKYSPENGLPPFNAASGFYENPQNILFITFRDGGGARFDGRAFRILSDADGLPAGRIGGVFADRAGRLWCWSQRGVYRIDDPNAAVLQPVFVATPPQLNFSSVGSIVADRTGSLYVATGQGVVRIDNASSSTSAGLRIASLYTTSDGLAGSEINSAYADRAGRLWFGTTEGLSYFEPEEPGPLAPPQVRIAGLRVADAELRISPAGEEDVSGVELMPGRAQLEVSFFGISFATGDRLSFEYRLVGAGDAWSAPQSLRSMLLANLAPGTYEFEVRAVSAGGERSVHPARVAFRVVPPVWRRWWFVALSGVVILSALAAFERYRARHRREISRAREERLVELERVRRRIAADLHDEIGSSLTQISILSEVAQRQGEDAMPELSRPLATIAASSRELVDSMSDIVWAINPERDHLSDLTQRMRRLAADAFTAGNTAFTLDLPSSEREVALGANVRREVFLIFKETVTNIVKHAACSEVAIQLAVEGGVLRLEIRDNGRGFDPLIPTDGHGLTSLRNRAAALQGSLAIQSAHGAGTTVTLQLPITT